MHCLNGNAWLLNEIGGRHMFLDCIRWLNKKGLLQNQSTSYSLVFWQMAYQYLQSKSNSEEETGKLIDSFQLELQWLKKYICSYSSINAKVYEFILTRYLSLLPTKEGCIVALCLFYISFESFSRAQAGQSMVQKSKWNQQFETAGAKVQEMRDKHREFGEQFSDFQLRLRRQGDIQELKDEYERFLKNQTFGIYKHQRSIWRMLVFQNYCARQMREGVMDQSQAVPFLQRFRQYLSTQQLELCHRQQSDKLFVEVGSLNQDYLNDQLLEMMRSETYLPLSHFQKKTGKSTSSGRQPAFKTGITIKDMLLLEINLETISLVERCQTYECPFMIFEIPFTYLLVSTLTYYTDFKELYLYHIFATLCKKINKIKNSSNPQLPVSEINDCLVDFMQFYKVDGRQHSEKLGLFLKKHQGKMSTFIPVYYQIFCFHAFEKYDFVDKLFAEKGSVSERRKKMKARIEEIYVSCQKYNSDNL